MKRNGNGIAIYIRLSDADEDTGRKKDESDSVKGQRLLIRQFLDAREEFAGMERMEFVDDGFTGTNTDRPAFQRMMQEIRDGSSLSVLQRTSVSLAGITLRRGTIWSACFRFWECGTFRLMIITTVMITKERPAGWTW